MESGGPGKMTGLAWRALAAALALVCLSVTGSGAASPVCRQLEAQLASLATHEAGGASQARRYDLAIVRQQQQIRKARAQARQAGCGRAIVGGSISACANLNATLERMRANLVDLQRERGQIGDGRRERARILAALDVNRCRAETPPPVDGGRVQAVIDGRTGLRINAPAARFRTLCVRTCDGYYFPVSWSVGQGVFERDEKACSAMCPGAEVEMFYHRVPGEEPEDMISVATGQPYRELPNAFLYRRTDISQPQGCSCGNGTPAQRGFEVIAGEHPSGIAEEEGQTAGLPAAGSTGEAAGSIDIRSDPSAAETAAAPEQPMEPSEPLPAYDPNREVRVVGPRFLPDPEEAIDLRAPVPNRDQ